MQMVEKRLDATWSGFRMPFEYSRDPKTDHSKTGFIRKPDISKVGFWDHSKTRLFVRFFNGTTSLEHSMYKEKIAVLYKTV